MPSSRSDLCSYSPARCVPLEEQWSKDTVVTKLVFTADDSAVQICVRDLSRLYARR
jgi:hypothetical protein